MGTRFSTRLLEDFNTKKHFPKIPFLALTATATQKSKKISSLTELGLQDVHVFEKSFEKTSPTWFLK
jgi:ATP-dependent DNA helicase RecQ